MDTKILKAFKAKGTPSGEEILPVSSLARFHTMVKSEKYEFAFLEANYFFEE